VAAYELGVFLLDAKCMGSEILNKSCKSWFIKVCGSKFTGIFVPLFNAPKSCLNQFGA